MVQFGRKERESFEEERKKMTKVVIIVPVDNMFLLQLKTAVKMTKKKTKTKTKTKKQNKTQWDDDFQNP